MRNHQQRDVQERVRFHDDQVRVVSKSSGGGGRGFSGIAYVSGKKYDVSALSGDRLRVIKSTFEGATVTRTNDPMPDPMPANENWRELTTWSGDVYIDC